MSDNTDPIETIIRGLFPDNKPQADLWSTTLKYVLERNAAQTAREESNAASLASIAKSLKSIDEKLGDTYAPTDSLLYSFKVIAEKLSEMVLERWHKQH